eukprot:424437_1
MHSHATILSQACFVYKTTDLLSVDVLASQVTDKQSSSVGGSILSRSARNRSRLHSKRLKAVSSIKSLLDDLSGLFEVSEGADQTTEIRREIMFVFGRSPLSAKVVYKIFLDFRANPTQTQPLSLKTLNLYPRKLLRCLVGSTAEQACPSLRPTRLCVYVKGPREANFRNFLPKQSFKPTFRKAALVQMNITSEFSPKSLQSKGRDQINIQCPNRISPEGPSLFSTDQVCTPSNISPAPIEECGSKGIWWQWKGKIEG